MIELVMPTGWQNFFTRMRAQMRANSVPARTSRECRRNAERRGDEKVLAHEADPLNAEVARKWRLWHHTPPLAAMPRAAICGPRF